MENLLEDISFNADDYNGQTVEIDENYVKERLSKYFKENNLEKYIL